LLVVLQRKIKVNTLPHLNTSSQYVYSKTHCCKSSRQITCLALHVRCVVQLAGGLQHKKKRHFMLF